MKAWAQKQAGFTIVELLIVIVVIGILAALTIVAYNGIQQRAAQTTVKSDLANAATTMGVACAETGDCPTIFPSSLKTSPNVGLSLAQTGSSTSYCINGSYSKYPDMHFYYQQGKGLTTGTCSGAVVYGSETGSEPKNLVLNTDFDGGTWKFNRANGNTITLTSRPGASGDPYPDRPVLVINNDPVAAGWSYTSGPLRSTEILAGHTYTLSLWARRTSGSVPDGLTMSVRNGDSTNVALTSNLVNFGTQWSYLTQTATATANGISPNVFYINQNGGSNLATYSWSMEIQAPVLAETQ